MFYGQIPKIAILPVTGGCVLRADPRNRHFARNRGLCFTGKSQKSGYARIMV
ncbi:vitamin B12-binding protein [Ligilactobacillus ruminis]|uniref:Vitamin B12-binding protein n=1 Tax=Ligilactobacillus ruminis TaxID=1623 RepID=A0AAQ2XKL8_9LACO|nr:vitamin B12-binding protein [Ligilactobacillus ruminis]WDC82249.1 vitamin B12-binding protein [Ligilactobacillus ruminis]